MKPKIYLFNFFIIMDNKYRKDFIQTFFKIFGMKLNKKKRIYF